MGWNSVAFPLVSNSHAGATQWLEKESRISRLRERKTENFRRKASVFCKQSEKSLTLSFVTHSSYLKHMWHWLISWYQSCVVCLRASTTCLLLLQIEQQPQTRDSFWVWGKKDATTGPSGSWSSPKAVGQCTLGSSLLSRSVSQLVLMGLRLTCTVKKLMSFPNTCLWP